jgi:hypothetical protein
LGPQRAAAGGCRAHDRLERGAGNRTRRLRRVLTGDGGDRGAFLQEPLDRCAGAAGQGARRVLASDGTFGASLRAAQLSGQTTRTAKSARPCSPPRSRT